MQVLSGVYWSAGRWRQCNQDTLALQEVMTARGRAVMALICDGIGGMEQGETASGFIAEEMIRWFYKSASVFMGSGKGLGQIEKSGRKMLFGIQEDLQKFGEKKELRLGSTMTILILFGRKYLLWHLGDSRGYIWEKKRMRLLTQDHCIGSRGLTKCMNSRYWIKPDILKGRIKRNMAFLLCSDGFYHVISPEQLEQAFRPEGITGEPQIESRLREIAEYSMDKGEQDNISAVYIKII